MKNIYTSFNLGQVLAQAMATTIVEGPRHITWEFNPGKCILPEGMVEGDIVIVNPVGHYKDDDCEVEVVEVQFQNNLFTHQSNGQTLLHITLNATGCSPFEAGQRANTGYTKYPKEVLSFQGIASIFRAPDKPQEV